MRLKKLFETIRTTSLSLPAIMTYLVMGIVGIAVIVSMVIFMMVYNDSMQQNAITTSDQAVVQASNAVGAYLDDMNEVMEHISDYYRMKEADKENMMKTLISLRSDVVAVTAYDINGRMVESYTGKNKLKDRIFRNLSYNADNSYTGEQVIISTPHVETLLTDYFPWVVSISKQMKNTDGTTSIVVMDILFSQIAGYVDDVGIGQHGYCFIMNDDGTIVYHPQQQLIFSGLKEEDTSRLVGLSGYKTIDNIIYTTKDLKESSWKVVGVSYVDELITNRTQKVIFLNVLLVVAVVAATFLTSFLLSNLISRPIRSLIGAMKEFEKDAEEFSYHAVRGSREIIALSNSFDHMVDKIQKLMNQVRQEEITLKKTELKALQAQINPHFLYNTLDAIGWLCEEERSQDAVKMVNALAKLFRISISKGQEMITVQKELEHAKSYLQIEKFRYKNQFTYTFIIEEECLPFYCNKITLQPIIENAIYHGLNRMVDVGEIKIEVKSAGDDIQFIICDNGVGMSEEECAIILDKEPNDRTGIGIKNVNDRIKIYFGEGYGLKIESELDVGTCVTITMPKVREEDLFDGK